jgi:acyl carrier protein
MSSGGPEFGPVTEFAEFAHILAEHFGIVTAIVGATRLKEDLGFDSLKHLELVVFLEEVGGHEVPTAVEKRLITVGDVFDVYTTYLGHRR